MRRNVDMTTSIGVAGMAAGEGVEIPLVPAGVVMRTYPNGLTVIVREDPSAPVVAAQAWCKAGSIDEGPWLGSGLSHVLEHMLFKGTTTRGAGRIDQEVQAAGGTMNAFTSFDRTVYWINVPNTGGRVAVDILCDIMQNATLPAEELAKEMEVIRREMDMGQDDPGRRSSMRLFETAYTVSPYRYTVIGYPDIFSRLRREDVVAYYEAKYAPNNVFLVVVGAIEAEAVFEQIGAAFAGAKARPVPAYALAEEPRQVAPREVIEEASIELGHVHWSWHVPDLRHPDVPLLHVLSVLLGAGRSSRLFREVRERRGLVTSVDSWVYSPGRAGLFGVSATLEAARFSEARGAIEAELRRLCEGLVSAAEVEKAVKQFTTAFVATRKTMQGQAQDLGGNWMGAGDLCFSERYLARVRRVTPDDLRRVAVEHLTEENRTVYALLPSGGGPRAAVGVELREESPASLLTLGNGLRLLVKEDQRLPLVQLRMVLGGGVLAESAERAGAGALMTRMLMQGTTNRTAEEIAIGIESVGGSLDTFSGNQSFGVSAEVLGEDLELGLEMLADVLLRPEFPGEALDRERQIQLAAIREQRDHLLSSAFRLFRRSLFGRCGYGLNPLGEEETVRDLTREDLRRHHSRWVVPGNAVLAVYGAARKDAVAVAVERLLGGWGGMAAEPLATGGDAVLDEIRRVEELRDKKQVVVVVGFPGVTLRSEDRFALDLIQEACSDLGSRLFLRVRERLGLAYYVGASHLAGLARGYFAFYAGTAPEHADRVEAELLAEAEALREAGLTADELERAKAKLVGQKKIGRQDLGSEAMTAALDELYGLGYDNSEKEDARVEAVTEEEVRAVATRHLAVGRHGVTVLRPSGCGG